MTYTLIHNPGCGSSKKGLALLQENGIDKRGVQILGGVGVRPGILLFNFQTNFRRVIIRSSLIGDRNHPATHFGQTVHDRAAQIL